MIYDAVFSYARHYFAGRRSKCQRKTFFGKSSGYHYEKAEIKDCSVYINTSPGRLYLKPGEHTLEFKCAKNIDASDYITFSCVLMHDYKLEAHCSISDFFLQTDMGRRMVAGKPLLPRMAVRSWTVRVTDSTEGRIILSENSYHYGRSSYTADVEAVFEGDYILVRRVRHFQKIYLAGINCPEPGQPYYAEAKAFVSKMVLDKQVSIRPTHKFLEDLLIAGVDYDGNALNEQLVKQGLAWYNIKVKNNPYPHLEALEKIARKRKVGLWAEPAPVPPWLYREQMKK